MSEHQENISLFRSLHKPGSPIILYNIWDAGSAKAVASSGAKALATGSAPVAMAQGYSDGEQMPLDMQPLIFLSPWILKVATVQKLTWWQKP